MHTQKLPLNDGHTIFVYEWHIEAPKALVHINHGMAEHALRYAEFAHFLNSRGYSVIAHNHRGHGPQSTDGLSGHYADQDGWQKVLADLNYVRKHCNPAKAPYVVFGHSMGSFITQAYALNYPASDALILSGSNWQPAIIYKAGAAIAHFEKWRKGPRSSSALLNALSFGSFNNAFKPVRTDFDWLSADANEVNKYINDPLCGFDCSTQLWIDLLTGLSDISRPRAFEKLADSLPIYLFAGELDPVGRKGKGMHALHTELQRSGHKNITLQLYKNGRHEMLNEVNKREVMVNIADWLDLQFVGQI